MYYVLRFSVLKHIHSLFLDLTDDFSLGENDFVADIIKLQKD